MLIVVLSVWAVWVGLGALALAELFIQDLSMGALLLVTDTPTSVVIVFESVVTFRLVLGAFALAGVVVVVLSVLTCRVGLGALALAGFLVENLSMRTVLPDTLATTCVWVVLVAVVTLRLILRASALAGIFIINLTVFASWFGRGALTLAGFLVENLSVRAPLPCTVTTTSVWIVYVSVTTFRLVFRA